MVTKGWPILQAGSIPNVSKDSWRLRVHGEVENDLSISYAELLSLKRTVQMCDIHCVTSWSKFDVPWEGVRFKDLMEIAKPTPKAHFVIFECEQGFTTNLPLEPLYDNDVMIAFKAQGEDLEAAHGGPVRMLVPKRVLLQISKVAQRNQADRERHTWFLGNTGIFQLRRSVERGKVRWPELC